MVLGAPCSQLHTLNAHCTLSMSLSLSCSCFWFSKIVVSLTYYFREPDRGAGAANFVLQPCFGMELKSWLRTIIQVASGLQGDVYGDGGVQHGGSLAEAALPGHVVGQLAQGVGDGAQVDAAVALPGAPGHPPVWRALAAAPGAQRVGMCLQVSSASVCARGHGLHLYSSLHHLSAEIALWYTSHCEPADEQALIASCCKTPFTAISKDCANPQILRGRVLHSNSQEMHSPPEQAHQSIWTIWQSTLAQHTPCLSSIFPGSHDIPVKVKRLKQMVGHPPAAWPAGWRSGRAGRPGGGAWSRPETAGCSACPGPPSAPSCWPQRPAES